MNTQILKLESNITMSSLELVTIINELREDEDAVLQHNDFMKKIVKVLGEERAGLFSSSYLSVQNKKLPCYLLPKREACLMVMSENYKIQAAVYDRLQELEQKYIPTKPLTELELAKRYVEALEYIEENKPKIEAFDNAKAIFSKKEPVYDKERGYKKEVNELYPFLRNDKITNILEYYTTKKYKDTNYYIKEEIKEAVDMFLEDCNMEISDSKLSIILYHDCFLGGKTVVNKENAIKYLGYCEEDFK